MAQLDAATQRNSRLVQDSAVAAGDLEQHARSLSQVVARFRIGAADAGAAAVAAH